MPHWLDEAERSINRHYEPGDRSARISHKYHRIQENYSHNGAAYNAFLASVNKLVERVNNLPVALRKPFGKIDSREKESKLNNHLNIFSSSMRLKKKRFLGFLPLPGAAHFKHFRVIFINISDHEGCIDIEIKERVLERERVKSDKMGSNDPYEMPNKFHVSYHVRIDDLNQTHALEIIDWLAFKKEITACSLYTMHPEEEKHFH